MPQRPALISFCESSVSPQIFSERLPVALRAVASQNKRPCCVRRSRTEVTSTINHTSSPWGISGKGTIPRIANREEVATKGTKDTRGTKRRRDRQKLTHPTHRQARTHCSI